MMFLSIFALVLVVALTILTLSLVFKHSKIVEKKPEELEKTQLPQAKLDASQHDKYLVYKYIADRHNK